MKVLVLNGSPKKEKSDTLHVTRAFLEGMNEDTQNEIRWIHVAEKNVKYCLGCFSCMRNGGRCVQTDDMKEILEEIQTADLLLLSFPLYCYGMPAPLKAVMDRILPLTSVTMKKAEDGRYIHTTQTDVSGMRFMMICGCGFPNSKQNFEPAVAQFRLMFRGDSTVITVPEGPMFGSPEAAVVTVPRLRLIREAGCFYAKNGFISDELLAEICSPMIPEEMYAQIVNGGIHE